MIAVRAFARHLIGERGEAFIELAGADRCGRWRAGWSGSRWCRRC